MSGMQLDPVPDRPGTRPWRSFANAAFWLSLLAAALALAGSVLGLGVPSIYAVLTPSFLPQALAQDVANLAVASPAMALLFALLWLSEDVPAWLAGTSPASLAAYGMPTNPVHNLELAFFIPAVVLTGVAVLLRVPIGYTLAPAFVVFLLLTGVPILVTPLVQVARGSAADWGAFAPIAVLTVLQIGLLAWLMPTVRMGSRP